MTTRSKLLIELADISEKLELSFDDDWSDLLVDASMIWQDVRDTGWTDAKIEHWLDHNQLFLMKDMVHEFLESRTRESLSHETQ